MATADEACGDCDVAPLPRIERIAEWLTQSCFHHVWTSQVVHFGALGMQVILSAFKTAGDRIQLINVSDKVLEQMRWMGMTPETIAEVAT